MHVYLINPYNSKENMYQMRSVFSYFQKQISPDILCESSAWIHTKGRGLFSLKYKKKTVSKCRLLQLWLALYGLKLDMLKNDF